MKGCKVRGSDAYLQGNALHTVNFHTPEYDTGGFWNPVGGQSNHVLIPFSGTYLVVAYAQWGAPVPTSSPQGGEDDFSGATRSVAVTRNGLAILGAEQRVSASASEAKVIAVSVQVLTAGDQVGVELYMTGACDSMPGQIQTLAVTKLD